MQEPVRRWLAPIAIGLAFGAVYFGLDSWTKFTALTNAHHGVATTQFVGVAPSILIFTGGAIISYAVFCLKKKKHIVLGPLSHLSNNAYCYYSFDSGVSCESYHAEM